MVTNDRAGLTRFSLRTLITFVFHSCLALGLLTAAFRGAWIHALPAFHQLTSSLSLLGYGAVTWVMGFGFVAMPIFFAIAWAIIFFVQIGPSAQLISLWYYLLFGGAVGASMFLGLPQPAIGWPEVFARLAGLLMASSVASFIELLHRQAAARRSPAVVSSVEAATRPQSWRCWEHLPPCGSWWPWRYRRMCEAAQSWVR